MREKTIVKSRSQEYSLLTPNQRPVSVRVKGPLFTHRGAIATDARDNSLDVPPGGKRAGESGIKGNGDKSDG
jgi:hypothetical protein